jgi:hypothetical protein
MLPDFPETKLLFTRVFQRYMRERMRQISPFGMIQTRRIFEGRSMKVTRSDETQSESVVVQQSVEFQVRFDEFETLTFDKVVAKYNAVIVEMAGKQANFIRERISAELPESQSVDARGKKLDAQMVIDIFNTMQVDFYPDGTPHEIHVDGPIWTSERIAAIDQEFKDSPELKQKYDEMMARKKEEWLAREGDRKLVG